MGGDRALGYEQPPSDLFVAEALGDELRDLHFALPEQRRARGLRRLGEVRFALREPATWPGSPSASPSAAWRLKRLPTSNSVSNLVAPSAAIADSSACASNGPETARCLRRRPFARLPRPPRAALRAVLAHNSPRGIESIEQVILCHPIIDLPSDS